MSSSSTSDPAVSTLRLLAILAVVAIHTTTRVFEFSQFDLSAHQFSLLLNQLSRFAVPLFFLISGFLIRISSSARLSYPAFLTKKVFRFLPPYIFWSAFYYFFVYTQHTQNFFTALLQATSSYQLYFLPALLLLQAAYPLINSFFRRFFSLPVLICLFLVQVGLLSWDYYFLPLPFPTIINTVLLNFFVFSFGVFAAGFRDRIRYLSSRYSLIFFFFASSLGVFTYLEGRNLYLSTFNYLSFYSQWRPSVLLYTLFLFGWLYSLSRIIYKHFPIINSLSQLSFFVYFVHVWVLEFTWHTLSVLNLQATSISGLLLFVLTSCISFALAALAHRSPQVSRITG